MGRHPRDWDPERFENSRKRQRRRQIAPLRSTNTTSLQGDPTSTILQLSSRSFRIDRTVPIPSTSQGVASASPGVSRSNTNMTDLYISVRRQDGTWVEARVLVVPGSKKMGIIEDFARYLGLFVVLRSENRRRSIAEGPTPTDRLCTDFTASVRIRPPGSTDPGEELEKTADVWRPDPSRPMDYDIRIPSNLRVYCKANHINGFQIATINSRDDFSMLLDDHQHNDTSNGRVCRLCFDMALLDTHIYPNHPQ